MSLPKPYYNEGGITIYHADCRDILPHLPKVDLVLTDPPYPNNERVLWTDIGEVSNYFQGMHGFYFWDAFYEFPMMPTAIHIWHKPNGQSSKQYERIFEVCGGAACKVFRIAAILPDYVQYRAECVDHPTQKPLKLVSRLIGKSQTILDPFMGSGTTLVAAKDLGRRAIGIEIEEKYVEIAIRRLQQEVIQFDYDEKQDPIVQKSLLEEIPSDQAPVQMEAVREVRPTIPKGKR